MNHEAGSLLGIFLKVFTAASGLGGIVALAMSYYRVEFKDLSPEALRMFGVGFIALSFLIGFGDLVYDRAGANGPPARAGGTGNMIGDVHGSVGSIVQIQNSPFRDLVVQPGDTAEQRREKLVRAQRLLAAEVAANLRGLDEHLQLVAAALEPDGFEQDLARVRDRIAPSLSDQHGEGYRRLIAVERAASLRHELNSARLRSDIPGPLLQVLLDAGSSGVPIQLFHSQLAEVERTRDSLLATMQDVTRNGPENGAYAQDRLRFHRDLLFNRIWTAHFAGLRVLGTLESMAQAEAESALKALRRLEPRKPLDDAAYTTRLRPLIEEAERLIARRQDLVAQAERRRDDTLAEYVRLDEQLRVGPADSWSTVVGKARSLRDLGRIGEAAGTFARYGEMFGPSDPTAGRYARTAQQFTLQIGALGVQGGIYLFEVAEGGAASKAGLRVGDILVAYGGRPVPGMVEIGDALHGAAPADSVRVDYLRLSADGRFLRDTATVPGGPLGVGMMPV
jgi:hypothetical protein